MASGRQRCWNTRLNPTRSILKQALSNVRASYTAMRGWLRRVRRDVEEVRWNLWDFCTSTTVDWSRYQMEVDRTRAVSEFLVWKRREGQIKRKGQDPRMVKGKGTGKKGEKSKDQKPQAKTEQFQGYCGYCEKWGHKRADCRKRIADGKSKGWCGSSLC